MDIAIVVVTLVALGSLIYFLTWTMRSLAPWIPSKTSMVVQALNYVQPKRGDRFVDLGCGDGRVVFLAYRRFGLRATGFEVSPFPYLIAKIRQMRYLNAPISIERKDLYTAVFEDYDILFVYGLPRTIEEKLEPALAARVKPGTWLISYNFSLKNKKPLKEFHEQWRNCFIYRY